MKPFNAEKVIRFHWRGSSERLFGLIYMKYGSLLLWTVKVYVPRIWSSKFECYSSIGNNFSFNDILHRGTSVSDRMDETLMVNTLCFHSDRNGKI